MSKPDPVVRFLGGIAQNAMAPIEAAIEMVAFGKVSPETTHNVCRSLIGDVLSDSVTNTLNK